MILPRDNERCDVCGAELEPEDRAVHLCKICQGMQFEDENGD